MARKWRASLLESPDSENPLTTIDFGIVPENTTASKTLWLRNLEDFEVHSIEIHLENDEVKVMGPSDGVLQPMEAKEVHFTWTVTEASVALKQAFRLLSKMLKTPE